MRKKSAFIAGRESRKNTDLLEGFSVTNVWSADGNLSVESDW